MRCDRLVVLTAAFFLSCISCAKAVEAPEEIIAAAVDTTPVVWKGSKAFQPGEKIHFRVKQFAVKAGDATLEFKGLTFLDGKRYALIVFRADGFNFYDEERIYVDPMTLMPEKIMRDLNIFGKKEKIMEEYSQKDGYVRVTKDAGGKVTVVNLEKKGAIDNIYSFIYRYRLQGTFDTAKVLDIPLPTLDVKVAYVKDIDFKVGATNYQAAYLKSVPEKYSMWFDRSESRLPLRISGNIGVMTMVNVEQGK